MCFNVCQSILLYNLCYAYRPATRKCLATFIYLPNLQKNNCSQSQQCYYNNSWSSRLRVKYYLTNLQTFGFTIIPGSKFIVVTDHENISLNKYLIQARK